jgi:hypothetical protein
MIAAWCKVGSGLKGSTAYTYATLPACGGDTATVGGQLNNNQTFASDSDRVAAPVPCGYWMIMLVDGLLYVHDLH